MSLLKVVKVDEAQGIVKEIYKEIKESFGSVPNALQLWSVSPYALQEQWNSIKVIMKMDADSQKLHTIMRFLIAERDDCEYCIGFNNGMLIHRFGFSIEDVQKIKENPSVSPLEEKNVALLVFALETVNNPHSDKTNDIVKLEEFGFSQKEIFDIVQSAAHMRVITTLFDTFKVKIDF